jgi:hypothetical protein
VEPCRRRFTHLTGHILQIHAQSVARSPFRTVSPRSTLAIRLQSNPHQPTDPSMPRDFLRVGVRGRQAKSLWPSLSVPLGARGGTLALEALPKGYPQGDVARSLRVAHFGALRAHWRRSEREQGRGAWRAGRSLSGWVRSIPTPSALNWLQSSSTQSDA